MPTPYSKHMPAGHGARSVDFIGFFRPPRADTCCSRPHRDVPGRDTCHEMEQPQAGRPEPARRQSVRPNTSPVALRQARQHLLDSGQCPSGLVDERLARSWSRSMAAGLLPTGRPQAIDHPSSGTLRQVLASNPELLAHSRPVMEYLFEQVRHSQSVVVLADRRGMLMHTLGDPYFVDKAERVALTSGASWHEAHRGTNAIGTALAEACAVEVHGGEHFLERNNFLTCAASPILSATGELLGILDISGDYRHGHAHTLGLVSTAARMIENRLLAATCKRNIRLHLHSAPEGIGSVAEGIVAVSADGWIVGANRVALAQLGLHAGDVGATLLERVLDVRLDDLLSHHKRRPQQPQALRTLQGALLFAQVQMDAAWVATPTRPTAAATAAPQQDALAQLDTGDARWRAAADKARRRLLADLATEQGLGFEVQVAPDLLARLAAYPWPGNLRQLANVLRTACAMLAEGEDTLGWEHMPDDLVQALTAVPAGPRSDAAAGTGVDGLPASLSLQQLSQAAIDQALQAARGNMSQAARQLGISRQTLYRKLKMPVA
eukprot:gene89-89_t